LAGAPLRCQTPKVGAECLSWACSDLCGGCAVMRIPTANRIDPKLPVTTVCYREGHWSDVRWPKCYSGKFIFLRNAL
jgi:hypothetical protein